MPFNVKAEPMERSWKRREDNRTSTMVFDDICATVLKLFSARSLIAYPRGLRPRLPTAWVSQPKLGQVRVALEAERESVADPESRSLPLGVPHGNNCGAYQSGMETMQPPRVQPGGEV